MRGYFFRQARPSDFEQLQQLGLTAYGQFKKALGNENWKAMEKNLKNDAIYFNLFEIARSFVCDTGSEIIGMAFLVPRGNPTAIFDADWSYIRLIGVHPKYEGQGIGRKLTQLCIDCAREKGENTIALHTSEFQNAARHIYESLGFKRLREINMIYGQKYFLYTLSLNTNSVENIEYHKANQNDIETLVENRILFALELTGEQPPDKIEALRKQVTAYFIKATADNSCISFIAKCNGETAGTGSVHIREMPGNFKNPSGKWGYIMNMYTLKPFRRKGICTGLLNALMAEAQKFGITAFELHATQDGEMVYRQNGFKIHKEPSYRKFIQANSNNQY